MEQVAELTGAVTPVALPQEKKPAPATQPQSKPAVCKDKDTPLMTPL